MNLSLKTWIASVWFSSILICVACFHASAVSLDRAVIRRVVTKSDDGVSTIAVQLSDRPTYKVIPLEDTEMLIAFKDTELSKGVFTNQTIIGDELIARVQLEQKPSDVACVLVRLHKPYTEIGYQTNEDNGMLRIEIRGKAAGSKRNAQQHEGADLKGQGSTDRLLKVDSKVASVDAGLFLEAAEHYRMGRWERVVPILREIIRSYPESRYLEQAYFLVANSLHRMFEKEISEHLVDIATHYQDAIGKFPDSDHMPHAIVSIGNCYFAVKNYSEALAYYNLVLEKHRTHPAASEALFQRGRVLALTKKHQEALRDFDELEKRYPKTRFAMEAKIEKAKTLFHMNSFKRSLAILDKLTTKDPDSIFKDPEILLYAGYNYYELGQLRKARDVLSKVMNYYPEMESNHLVLTKIAEAYHEEGAERKASRLYDLVARTYPDSEGSLVSLLRLADYRQKAQGGTEPSIIIPIEEVSDGTPARDIYEQIIGTHRDNPLSQLAMLKFALLQQKDKNYEQSIITLRKMLEEHSQTLLRDEIKTAIQAALEPFFGQEKQAGKIENIISYYERIRPILSIEDAPNLLLIVGEAYSGLRLYAHAIPMFEKASRFFADHNKPANLLFGLGECYYEVKSFDKAERALRAFVARYPKHSEALKAHYWMGNIFLEQKDYEAALKSLSIALRQKTDEYFQTKVLIAMANALNGQGNHKGAERSLRKAIALLNQLKDTSSDHFYVAYRELGETYIKLGQNEKAVSALEKALNLGPQGSRRHSLELRLAQCWQRLKATGKAKDMLDHIIASGDPFWSKMAEAQIREINIKKGVEKFGYGLAGREA